MISRHAGWMVIVTASMLTTCVTTVLMVPALACAARRRRRGASCRWPFWTWDLAGAVLGTLLLLGPLQTIQGLHPTAPIALAVGAGTQLRRWLVWRSRFWQRISLWFGGLVVCLLPGYALWQWHSVASAPALVWSRPAAQTPNLLWIVLDTVRADHMSVYGYNRPTTPRLAEWAQNGITFDMARSAAAWTLPSHVTMFTGLWPSQHGAGVDQPYFGSAPTLAEHLRARGYATAGFVANVRMCNRSYGVGRGFDTYVDYPWNEEVSLKAAMNSSALGVSVLEVGRRLLLPVFNHYPFDFRRPSRTITDEGRLWLDDVSRRNGEPKLGSRRPFFLFLNLMDAHCPYLPSPDASRKFSIGTVTTKEEAMPKCGWHALQEWAAAAADDDRPRRQRELEAVTRRLGDLYDDCLLGMDQELGRFLGSLRDDGLLTNTWVVITADHGEHFGEHSQFGHGSSLYNELTHVPLILIPPLGSGAPDRDPARALRGRRIAVPVSTRNLARTLASLIDPLADNPFPGRSLGEHWAEAPSGPPDPVLAQIEEPGLRGADFRTENVTRVDSLVDEDRILIDTRNQPPELYDLFADPRQQRNLADQPAERSRLERLKRKLDGVQVELGRTPASPAL